MKWIIGFIVATLFAYGALWAISQERAVESVPVPGDALMVFKDPRFAVPAGWQWERLDTNAGSVRWGHAGPESARGTVFFLPGYSAPLEIYFETFSTLIDHGYAVIAMDWPGQGGSDRGSTHDQKIHATSLDGHVEAARILDSATRGLYVSEHRLMVALSMGAQLGARVVAKQAEPFAAAALVTPAFGLYGGRPNQIERALLGALSLAGFGERYAPGSTDWTFDMDAHEGTASACSHPNARTRLWQASMVRDEAIKVGGLTSDFAMALVRSAEQSRATALLEQIKIPVWMPLAENDVFVDNDVARDACSTLMQCRVQQYAEAKHCLFEESDQYYQEFVADLIRFLDTVTPIQ